MEFPHLLHDLIGLTGRRVSVSVSAPDGHPALTCAGVLSGGLDVLDADADEHEVLHFPITGDADAGFLIARATFTGAAWHGDVLDVELGPLVLMIECAD